MENLTEKIFRDYEKRQGLPEFDARGMIVRKNGGIELENVNVMVIGVYIYFIYTLYASKGNQMEKHHEIYKLYFDGSFSYLDSLNDKEGKIIADLWNDASPVIVKGTDKGKYINFLDFAANYSLEDIFKKLNNFNLISLWCVELKPENYVLGNSTAVDCTFNEHVCEEPETETIEAITNIFANYQSARNVAMDGGTVNLGELYDKLWEILSFTELCRNCTWD